MSSPVGALSAARDRRFPMPSYPAIPRLSDVRNRKLSQF
jgi:hypothetical protein